MAKTSSGGTPKRSRPDFYENGTIPWIKIGDLNESAVVKAEEMITPLGLRESGAEILSPGTVLFAMYGSIGKLGVLGVEAATNQAVCALRPDEAVLSRDYLLWFLRWQRPFLKNAGFGGVQSNLSQKVLKQLAIPIPTAKGQKKIVDQLTAWFAEVDAAADCLESALNLSASMRQQIIDETVKADGICEPLSQCLAEPLRNGRSVPTREGGFPVLRLTALRDGAVDLTEAKPGDWTEDDARPYLVASGDFLVTRGNGSLRLVGRGGLVSDVGTAVAFPDTLIRVRADAALVQKEYLQLVWNSSFVRRQIERAARTTAGIYKINHADLGRVQIPVPPINEQNVAVEKAGRQLNAVRNSRHDLRRVRLREGALRKSILAKGFPWDPAIRGV